MDHVNTPINEIVVMYRSAEKVIRPTVPTDVSGHHVMISFSVSRCDKSLQTVLVLRRPLGQKTSSQSQYQ